MKALSLVSLALFSWGCADDPMSVPRDVAPMDSERDAPSPDARAPDGASAIDASTEDTPADARPLDDVFADAPAGDGSSECAACAVWGEPSNLGVVRSAALLEASGIAASRRTPGVYYVHNDSGDTARFFAVRGGTGAVEAEYHLVGARASDWEDLAVGPCPAGECVFIGDIGDNDRNRTEYAIYRGVEPEVSPGVHPVTFERFPYVYPDGAHNAETLLVLPRTGAVYVVTKTDVGNSVVYRLPSPLRAGVRVTVERVAELHAPGASPLFTGGSAHPCEASFLLRTYNRLYLYRVPSGMPFEAAFGQRPETMPVAVEPQGEAVAFRADGRGYVTLSEGVNQVIHGVGCM